MSNKIATVSNLNINGITHELIKIQEQNSNCSLWQFRSLVSANQYLRLYKIFLKYVPKESEVLDWGCGNGHFSYFLVKAGYKTSGFAFEDFCVRETPNSSTYEFRKGSAEDPTAIPYPDNKFNAIVSVGVLEHVRETGGNEITSLREIFRLLQPGGVFICYHFPNQFSLIEAIASRLPNKYHHQYRYTRQSIKTLCQETGFEVLEVQRYGFLPRNMWGVFPKAIGNFPLLAWSWDFLDDILAYPFSVVCQNYLFVARKPLAKSSE
ncbi:class I SAM-dependent methyltransferase [Coleofasciculus sp. FACHB-T130]|uniref:class I SAM-dependent methyltransferase n=1 Tax=Cyanophyceae TaxID=3028117 RepID=UPI0016873E02|nr:class I SAM-dependent methyltransferase [Coleofasciculus sp. FACHB-T130]MBD1879136.1 class I SAM-dependent methyltransferase [Coleofasciculus sp. FACHB-T130]